MRNRIASLAMCLCMFVTLLPTAAWAESVATPTAPVATPVQTIPQDGISGDADEGIGPSAPASNPSDGEETTDETLENDLTGSPTTNPSDGEEPDNETAPIIITGAAFTMPLLLSGPVTLGEGVKMQVTIGATEETYDNFAEGWNVAVAADTATVKLLADWTADDETHSFGTGAGFESGAILVPAGKNITLNLNGYTIDRDLSEATTSGSVIINKGTLTVNGTGTITGGNTSGYGGGVYNNGASASFTMNGGTIKNNSSGNGGGVYSYGGTASLTNVDITGNSAISGGGVYNSGGATFTMTRGGIKDNQASTGGGVYNSSTFTMTGGTIATNTSTNNGGGVYNNQGTASLTDVAITGNNAENGNGGGVHNNSTNATFTMTRGTIASNTSESGSGGGVYNFSAATFTINGGTIASNTSAAEGGGVYDDATLNVGGAVQITGNIKGETKNNVYLLSGKYITVAGELTSGASIGVTKDSKSAIPVTIFYADKPCAKYFFSDNADYVCEDAHKAKEVVQLVAPRYGISLSQTGTYTFDGKTSTGLTVTATNAGNQPTGTLTVALSGTSAGSFTCSPATLTSLAVGGTDTFTVTPETGLAAGNYSATVTVSNGQNGIYKINNVFYVYFTVESSAPEAPAEGVGYAIDYAAETITIGEGYEVSTSTNFTTTVASGSNIRPGTTYYVRVKVTGGVPIGESTPFTPAHRPATPTALTADKVMRWVNTITIEATGTNLQFGYASSTDASPAWVDASPATATTIDNLTPGTSYKLYVRTKATDRAFCSEISTALSVTTLDFVDTSAIEGVTKPVTGGTPVANIRCDQYTGSVTWEDGNGTSISAPDTFKSATTYTATITLTEKPDYVFAPGVAANFFTVADAATVTNVVSGTNIVVTARFPATAAKPVVPSSPSYTYNPYFIISGVGQAYTGKALAFRSTAEYKNFLSVDVDGKTLMRGTQYGVRSGSTLVTLYNDFLKTLKPGTHTLTVNSVGGSASTTFTVGLNSAQTGDAGILLYAGMALLSLTGMGYVGRKKKLF